MLIGRLTVYLIDAVVLVVLAAGGFVAIRRDAPLKQQRGEGLARVRPAPSGQCPPPAASARPPIGATPEAVAQSCVCETPSLISN